MNGGPSSGRDERGDEAPALSTQEAKGLSADERRHVIGGLIAASPELREVAQRLETLSSFAAVAEPVRSWV